MELQGRVVLVTGSAKRLGRSIALELAQAGADVVVHYHRSAGEARSLVRQIHTLGRRAISIAADLTEPPQIARLFELIDENLQRLDVLVNNASLLERGPLEQMTVEQWERLMAINARAAALCAQQAAKRMKQSGQGRIINMIDVAATRPFAGYVAYCSSKGALATLTRTLAKALAPQILVNGVSPGLILLPEGQSDRQIARLMEKVPMGRAGRPEEIAATVRFLAETDYITGQIIDVDGGRSLL